MGKYGEYKNLCFVDTLDNMGFDYLGKQTTMFGLSAENLDRIKRQNERKISVIIGNPPYNAKQENYNYQNSNRAYAEVDKRIRDTYIKHGTAQNQIVIYDMYARFLRWATDRLNEDGIIAFISNNSFLDGKAFDGFRKVVSKEFNYLYAINLKGNARTSGERRRQEGGNIFSDEIRVGVAIYFLVRKKDAHGFTVFYDEIGDYVKAEEKKDYLNQNTIETINFEHITPNENFDWINQTDNDFDELLPLIDKNVKTGKGGNALFKTFSRGIASQRDEWVYDFNEENLKEKIKYFISVYNSTLKNKKNPDKFKIKWDRELQKYLERRIKKDFSEKQITRTLYRPYSDKSFYFDKHLNGMTYQWFEIFRQVGENKYITIPGLASPKDFHVIASNTLVDLNCLPAGCQNLPLFYYGKEDQKIENITDWGLQQFQQQYENTKISKEDIFHYVYAVLHNPAYREKYQQNLKRDFPRIPFYNDFKKWAAWGKKLMKLHANYETAEPYPLKEVTTGKTTNQKPKLKADKESGTIVLDDATTLSGIPPEAWDYKLGNRSALEWVLDQYKPSKPKDPTIAEKFNTYRFADHKAHVIELLKKVCRVSVETVEVVRVMEEEKI